MACLSACLLLVQVEFEQTVVGGLGTVCVKGFHEPYSDSTGGGVVRAGASSPQKPVLVSVRAGKYTNETRSEPAQKRHGSKFVSRTAVEDVNTYSVYNKKHEPTHARRLVERSPTREQSTFSTVFGRLESTRFVDGFINRFCRTESNRIVPQVLLHGYAAGNGFWMFVLKELSAHFRVVCVEMYGCGRSDRLPFNAKGPAETVRHRR